MAGVTANQVKLPGMEEANEDTEEGVTANERE